VEKEEAARGVERDAARHAGVGLGAPGGLLQAVPAQAASRVLRNRVEQVTILHELLHQDSLPLLRTVHAWADISDLQTFVSRA
jgi:hypothetical protein